MPWGERAQSIQGSYTSDDLRILRGILFKQYFFLSEPASYIHEITSDTWRRMYTVKNSCGCSKQKVKNSSCNKGKIKASCYLPKGTRIN